MNEKIKALIEDVNRVINPEINEDKTYSQSGKNIDYRTEHNITFDINEKDTTDIIKEYISKKAKVNIKSFEIMKNTYNGDTSLNVGTGGSYIVPELSIGSNDPKVLDKICKSLPLRFKFKIINENERVITFDINEKDTTDIIKEYISKKAKVNIKSFEIMNKRYDIKKSSLNIGTSGSYIVPELCVGSNDPKVLDKICKSLPLRFKTKIIENEDD